MQLDVNIKDIGILIGVVCTLGASLANLWQLAQGQGKAKAREEGFTSEISSLKNKDIEIEGTIGCIKTDITDIKINQVESVSALTKSIGELEINILKEFRKRNGYKK